MKNIVSQLTEKIILQKLNENTENTTENMFEDVLPMRACIRSLFLQDLFQVVMFEPPSKFMHISFAGIKWNGEEYEFVARLQSFEKKFLKGVIAKIV